MKNREPWSFCETPKEKCTMNYCDENGCQNRKRNYVDGNDLVADVIVLKDMFCECKGSGCIRIEGNCGRCEKPLELVNNNNRVE